MKRTWIKGITIEQVLMAYAKEGSFHGAGKVLGCTGNNIKARMKQQALDQGVTLEDVIEQAKKMKVDLEKLVVEEVIPPSMAYIQVGDIVKVGGKRRYVVEVLGTDGHIAVCPLHHGKPITRTTEYLEPGSYTR